MGVGYIDNCQITCIKECFGWAFYSTSHHLISRPETSETLSKPPNYHYQTSQNFPSTIRSTYAAERREVRETSRKPDEVYNLIERMWPGCLKLELFGRPHNCPLRRPATRTPC